MHQLTIETTTASNAKLLASFLKSIAYISSVRISPLPKQKANTTLINGQEEEYNWLNPSRPATDEEFEQMISEAEKSPSMTLEEAKAHTYKLLDKWRKESQ